MKLSNGIKSVLVKKLSEAFETKVTLAEFNEVFLFLDKCDSEFKIVPYGVFENVENLERLKSTTAGHVFNKWLEKTTGNIEKDFNKGRKLVRVFKDIVSTNEDSLAYNLKVNNLFTISLTALFMGYNNEDLNFKYPIGDVKDFNIKIEHLRNYLAAIFFIDMVTDPLVIENLISLFINGKLETLIGDVIEQGIIYSENWTS